MELQALINHAYQVQLANNEFVPQAKQTGDDESAMLLQMTHLEIEVHLFAKTQRLVIYCHTSAGDAVLSPSDAEEMAYQLDKASELKRILERRAAAPKTVKGWE